MKQIVLTILFAFSVAVNVGATTPKEVRDTTEIIPIFGGGPGGLGGGNKGLIINEVHACIVSFGDMVYVLVTVTQNLGQVEFNITNSSTGEYLDGEFNALPGSYPIPISGSPGYYTITFILPDGRSCYGTFELN